ncbi:GNAT family N-acetyltransferase [Robiginitalea sp. SC105]|uniref:GNAT family N-acetyltransferase n=1 Tax=Robiginitalea sp. SC105 TaxID=2762332 RepID=UPI00163A8178|nr:GNAT family N-acetyltransferase [Robiginitalea sp. SC105]MBC2840319.1 GNAT family N-acetyltransferase [Robiginitalea sp. SC105]
MRTRNLITDLYRQRRIPSGVGKISLRGQNSRQLEPLWSSGSIDDEKTKGVFSICLIPAYLDLQPHQDMGLSIRTGKQTNFGYAIELGDKFNPETYLREQLRGNYRNLRKRISRLESCFDIRYELFYGDIGQQEYDQLMEQLYKMISIRFGERRQRHDMIADWEQILSESLEKIRKGHASLFVIRAGGKPIDISLNYHFGRILYGGLSSYDTNFSKFGLGAIEKTKLLEWCADNGYRFMDFGYGDLPYKKEWGNLVYRFKYLVGFDAGNPFVSLVGHAEYSRLRFREFLKSLGVNRVLRNLKNRVRPGLPVDSSYSEMAAYSRESVEVPVVLSGLREINPEDYPGFPLERAVNDFVYTTTEHRSGIRLFEFSGEPNTFLTLGQRHAEKVRFDP